MEHSTIAGNEALASQRRGARNPRRAPRGFLVLGIVVSLAGAGGATAFFLLRDNLHAVVEGQIYRSGQLSGASLRQLHQAKNLRSVINLRGQWPGDLWYDEEAAICQELGIQLINIGLGTHRIGPPDEVRKLVAALDQAPRPLLIHCRKGADRTSLAVAVYLLLFENQSLEQARQAYSLWYGHTGWARGYHLPHLFEEYQRWLVANQRTHHPDEFRRFVAAARTFGWFGAEFIATDFPKMVKVGVAVPVTFRVKNISQFPWRVGPPNHGIHLYLHCWRPGTRPLVAQLTGSAEAGEVPPGATVEFRARLPSFKKAEKLAALADLHEAGEFKFLEMGPSGWSTEFEVVE